jgi:hypothetical protein
MARSDTTSTSDWAPTLLQGATIAAGLWAGAALYASVAEAPARRRVDPTAAVEQWRASFPAAFAMQGSLTVAACGLTLAAWHARGQVDAPLLAAGEC